MTAQVLDSMELEREKGVTIKASAVRMLYTAKSGETYELNMGEGAILVVDASQGVEAQTLANLYLALDADLTIIPVVNKIDLPAARPEKYAAELAGIIGCDPSDVLRVSAKTGEGVKDLLDAIVAQVNPPEGDPEAPAR